MYAHFLLLFLLFPIRTQTQSCSPYNFSCGNYTLQIQPPFFSNPNPNCKSLYLIQCMNFVPVIQLHGQAFFYPVSNISYPDKTLTIHDLKLSSFFRGSNCVFLYDFKSPIPNFNVSNFTEHLSSSVSFFDCDEAKSCDLSHGVFGDEIYELYYGDDDLEGNRGFGYCGKSRDLWFDWRLSFDGKDGSFSLLSAGFSRKWTSFPDCFDCQIQAGNCSSKHCRELKSSVVLFDSAGVVLFDSAGGDGAHNKKIMIGSASGMGFLVVCLSLVLYFYKHWKVSGLVIFGKKDLNNNKKIEALLEEYVSVIPKRYSYSDVKEITKAFHEKLGQGGYGTVYKGTLRNGHAVAVKILNDSKGDGEEFINEVASICRTSHVNVVSLLGFCYEGSKKALIYDFMCNGSLEKLFYSEKSKTTNDWQRLYEIAIGIARGLEYLHRGCNTRIVHFDIKPHNILLDQNFCPKICDFGLAKLCLKKESIISIAGARGTIGYIAPEVFSRNFGVVSSKSDVYSYGMLVLEIVGGRKNPNEGVENSSEAYFPHWIYAQLNQNGHLSTCGITAESEEIARKMVLVGLWCIQTLPENRPSMSRVMEMMEGSVDDLQIPPKPYLSSSPFGSIIGTSSVQDVCTIDCSSSVDS